MDKAGRASEAGAKRRLFFALWPDEAIRAAIVRRRALLGEAGPRRVPDHNLHLTLLFLGDRPAAEVHDILQAAAGVHLSPVTLTLDRFGWFPRAGVVWLGGEAPAGLAACRRSLADAMRALDVPVDDRPFRPHVTLFRKVRQRPRLPCVPPLDWPVRRFALVQSRPGRPYRFLASWPPD